MKNSISVLVHHEYKKRGQGKIFLVINLGFLIFTTYQTVVVAPIVNEADILYNYVSNVVYQLFAAMVFFMSFTSAKTIMDIKRYSYLLSFPLKELDIFTAIKLNNSKNLFVTVLVILLPLSWILLRFKISIFRFSFFVLSIIVLAFICYALTDLIILIAYVILPVKSLLYVVVAIMAAPMWVIQNNADSIKAINFYSNNEGYIYIIDKIFPYCRFLLVNLFNNPGTLYISLTAFISIAFGFLLIKFNQALLQVAFFKIIEKEDNKRSTYSKISVDEIKPRPVLIAYFLKEYRFIMRENKKVLFDIMAILAVLIAFFGMLFFTPFISEILLKVMNIPPTDANSEKIIWFLINWSIVVLSLFVSLGSFNLNIFRIRLGKETLPFEKYIQLSNKPLMYSILIMRIIGSVTLFSIIMIILFFAGIYNKETFLVIPLALVNIASIAILDLILDIVIPNIKNKGIVYMSLDVLKIAVCILCRIFYLSILMIVCYLVLRFMVNNIFIPAIFISSLFLSLMVFVLNSDFVDRHYKRIGC
ncbi:hypothetical protein ACPWSR_03215 [Alloiococcus sp. CFN-8]|uniref:hypothetical protein n=1 Tax=Alloiococcus sp. CFN-8 TaxID=3416081 RepID=UPI003CFB072E